MNTIKRTIFDVVKFLVVLILCISIGFSIFMGGELSSNRLLFLYRKEGYEELKFEDFKDANNHFRNNIRKYDDEFDCGAYVYIHNRSKMRQIFLKEDAFLSSIIFEPRGIKYDKSMKSITCFQHSGYDESDSMYSMAVFDIEFDSEKSANKFCDDFFYSNKDNNVSEGGDDNNDSIQRTDAGKKGGITYAIAYDEEDSIISYVGYYMSDKNLLMIISVGTVDMQEDLEDAIDEYCEMVDILSPTEV